MEFSVNICKVIDVGRNSPIFLYKIMNSTLTNTVCGVMTNDCMKIAQCLAAFKKSNQMLQIVRKGTENKTETQLYKFMINKDDQRSLTASLQWLIKQAGTFQLAKEVTRNSTEIISGMKEDDRK